jgi:hypothetical protein
LAPPTDAGEVDGIIGNHETPDPLRERNVGDHRGLDVEELAAALADEVMVGLASRIEANDGVGMEHLSRRPDLNERVEHPINGGPRETRQSLSHRLIDLVRGRMIGAPDELFQDDPALHRKSQTPLLAKLLVPIGRQLFVPGLVSYSDWY